MRTDSGSGRRHFMRLCASALALIGASPRLLAQPDAALRRYHRTRLIDPEGRPVTAADLKVGENYLFHYPYISTPCFLLNLGRPAEDGMSLRTEDGRPYRWEGGVGPQRSVVAFSAICAHRMSHPARQVSFINYRHQPANFTDSDNRPVQRGRVIYCCSEKSVYDPVRGARVLGGPAKQPLAAIALEEDPGDGTLYAAGTYGGEMFEKFFHQFSFRLAIEYRTADIRTPVTDTTTVMPLSAYCRNRILC